MKYISCILFLISNLVLAQHTIKGLFSPPENYEVALLYKVTPTISEYVTNAEVKDDGSFVFNLDANAQEGMYRIVYAVPQEDFNFDVIYNKKENIELTFNTETGIKFKTSSENKLLASYTSSMSMITGSITKFFREKSKDSMALKAIFKTQIETQANYEKLAKGTLALNFIKANKPYTPKKFVNVETYISNLKTHYFDAIDFTNPVLQSSSFLEERMLNYIFGISDDNLDENTNYKNNIDVFCKALQPAPLKVKRILLTSLWQQMADLKNETVANYISDKYLIPIAKDLNDTALIKSLSLYRNLSFGHIAPDFALEITKDGKKVATKLSELKSAKNYIIVFWSSTCSHCLNEVPQLKTFVETFKKEDLKVIAIALEEEPSKWKSLTQKFPNFIHVYGAGKWENKICDAYGVFETPTYFILDKEKRIVGKPKDLPSLKGFFKGKK